MLNLSSFADFFMDGNPAFRVEVQRKTLSFLQRDQGGGIDLKKIRQLFVIDRINGGPPFDVFEAQKIIQGPNAQQATNNGDTEQKQTEFGSHFLIALQFYHLQIKDIESCNPADESDQRNP